MQFKYAFMHDLSNDGLTVAGAEFPEAGKCVCRMGCCRSTAHFSRSPELLHANIAGSRAVQACAEAVEQFHGCRLDKRVDLLIINN
jgi:hypothetical protein